MNRPSARALFPLAAALGLVLLLAGCSQRTWRTLTENLIITSLTPDTLPENPSGLYTFSVQVRPTHSNVVTESIRVRLTIDGQTYDMVPSALGPRVWDFDHAIALGRTEAAFFITVNYEVARDRRTSAREDFTPLRRVRIVNRYPLSLEAVRGPVGASIAILGRGFERGDQVQLGDTPAPTEFAASNVLRFTVPAVEAGMSYPVRLVGSRGELVVGTFRVDRSVLSVAPAAFFLSPGQRVALTVSLPGPAGPGGVVVNASTDIPASVILPEILIPAGARTATVPLLAGPPGQGTLYLEAAGFDPVSVPVTVN